MQRFDNVMSSRIQLQKNFWSASLYQKLDEISFVYILRLKKKIKEKEEKNNVRNC